MSSRCSCVLPTQEWNLPFPSPEPSKEGGKVLVSPSHEARCCYLEQCVHWIVPPCGEAPCAAPKTMEVPWRKAVLSALPSTTSAQAWVKGASGIHPRQSQEPLSFTLGVIPTLSLPRPPSSVSVMI